MDIELLDSPGTLAEAVTLFHGVWGGPSPLVNVEMLVAIVHSGGYVAGARVEGALVGASFGLLARHHDRLALHSHVTGLLPAARGCGLGRELKAHQYRWAAQRGIERITWTFDPLVRANAWFNIAVLGAEVDDYLPAFYGSMADDINAGDDSDRLLMSWAVDADRTDPLRHGREPTGGEAIATVDTPDDIVAIRRRSGDEARRWRHEVRESLTGHLAAGRRIVGFSPDGRYLIGSGR